MTVVVLVLTILSHIFSILWIFAILKNKSAEMKPYKFSMLQVAVSDLLTNLIGFVVIQPEFLLPLPAGSVNPLLQNSIVALIAFIVAGLSLGSAYFGLVLCCFTRFVMFYNISQMRDFLNSKRGHLVYFAILLFSASIFIAAWIFGYPRDSTVYDYANLHKLTHLLDGRQDEVILFFNLDDWKSYPCGAISAFLLMSVQCIAVYLSFRVWHKIFAIRGSFSARTFKMQRSFTIMLLLQNAYPIICLSLPVTYMLISVQLNLANLSGTSLLTSSVLIVASANPLVGSVLSFIFVRPYRLFLFNCVNFVVRYSVFDVSQQDTRIFQTNQRTLAVQTSAARKTSKEERIRRSLSISPLKISPRIV